jgi:hypothetical protein
VPSGFSFLGGADCLYTHNESRLIAILNHLMPFHLNAHFCIVFYVFACRINEHHYCSGPVTAASAHQSIIRHSSIGGDVSKPSLRELPLIKGRKNGLDSVPDYI